jgi:hypothetical protein
MIHRTVNSGVIIGCWWRRWRLFGEVEGGAWKGRSYGICVDTECTTQAPLTIAIHSGVAVVSVNQILRTKMEMSAGSGR